jgi:hypothetical protein
MLGIGAHLYTSIDNKTPSIRTMLQVYGSIVLDVPYIKFGIQFCTTQVLDAFNGATHVHVVDYGILYGSHWPCLIKELAMRLEGPLHLRSTSTYIFHSIVNFQLKKVTLDFTSFNWLNFNTWY